MAVSLKKLSDHPWAALGVLACASLLAGLVYRSRRAKRWTWRPERVSDYEIMRIA